MEHKKIRPHETVHKGCKPARPWPDVINDSTKMHLARPILLRLVPFYLGLESLPSIYDTHKRVWPPPPMFPKFIQGDHSACSQGCVDIKTTAAFYYMDLILKRNLCFDVNTTLWTSKMVTLYTYMSVSETSNYFSHLQPRPHPIVHLFEK